MPSEPARIPEEQLQRALVALGRDLDYPALSPALPARVVARISEADRSRRRVPALRRALVLVPALVVLGAGAVVARFAVRGVDIVFSPGLPQVPAGLPLDLGRPVSLAEARGEVAFAILVPAALGDPDEAYVDQHPPGGRISLVYLARDGLPAAPHTQAGLLLVEFEATIEPDFLSKVLGQGTTVEQVDVAGSTGLWITGRPHAVAYRDPQGRPLEDSVRLAGNVLLWQRGAVTLRLESALGRDEAIRIAESVR